MKKQKSVAIALVAIITVFVLGYQGFGWEKFVKSEAIIKLGISFSANDKIKLESWNVFQKYIKLAKAHDIEGLRALSHQISDTCNDNSKRAECNNLMDNVYTLSSSFELSDFKHIETDDKQIVLYTDGPTVVTLFFTREDRRNIKVLGMRFCFEDPETKRPCVDAGALRLDSDGNGWWDEVESLFYQ